MVILYNLAILLYTAGIRIASLWNPKARAWVRGRHQVFEKLQKRIGANEKTIWVHCSSAGELEQGKPVIEQLKLNYPSYKMVISFFSPSGYQVAGKYPFADVITYIPVDNGKNARRFIDLIHPDLVIFIKYEFWYHHLNTIAERKIPLLLVSAVFRKTQPFFSWYGGFYRKVLAQYHHIFVQDRPSLELLRSGGFKNCSVSGDTRFDRVSAIASQFNPLPVVEHFINGGNSLVAGSTWPDDEKILSESASLKTIKIVIAPHEIREEKLVYIERLFSSCFRYSRAISLFEEEEKSQAGNYLWSKINQDEREALKNQLQKSSVLIIDNVGLLSKLYHYATIAYVGGGYTKDGIHNILEAAVYGKPVIFGPNFSKYREAVELINRKGAFTISKKEDLDRIIRDLLQNEDLYRETSLASKEYVVENTGASQAVMDHIQRNRLLTR